MNESKTIQKGDFIELEYTGRTEEGIVFDTTEEKIAKENGLYSEHRKYEPIVICVGKNHILKGLDEALPGKEVGKEYNIELAPEKAFGKRTAALIKLVSLAQFKKHKLDPSPGMQVEIDGRLGVIKSVGGGRVLVDFNHPLAGKKVNYTIKIKRRVSDEKEKVAALLKLRYGIENAKIEVKNKEAVIEIGFELPLEIKSLVEKEIKETLKRIENVVFKLKKENKEEEKDKKEEIDTSTTSKTTEKGKDKSKKKGEEEKKKKRNE